MSEPNEEFLKRLSNLEEAVAWLKDRVWFGTGNLHDRVHKLEDRSSDRSFELEKIKEDVKSLKQIVGVEGYGGRNLINDLRDAVDAIDNLNNSFGKLKENLITTKDFQSLMQIVDQLRQRDQAQIKFWDYVKIAVVGVIVTGVANAIIAPIVARMFGGTP
jgi:hypothetical protein